MQMIPVESSQIHSIGYDEPTKTLRIQFKNSKGEPGSLYSYANVPPELHVNFMAAESKGKFFGANIKTASDLYPFTKICIASLSGSQMGGG